MELRSRDFFCLHELFYAYIFFCSCSICFYMLLLLRSMLRNNNNMYLKPKQNRCCEQHRIETFSEQQTEIFYFTDLRILQAKPCEKFPLLRFDHFCRDRWVDESYWMNLGTIQSFRHGACDIF